MGQKFYLIFIVLISIGSSIYFRNKDKYFQNRDKLLFCIGFSLVVVGAFIVQLLHGEIVLIDCLLLNRMLVSGKLILIGYIFIIISFFIVIEKIIKSLFRV